jgi:tetraprenyl-beta-curcumene synthase
MPAATSLIPAVPARRPVDEPSTTRRAGLSGVFVATIARYLATVLPQVDRELVHWQARAQQIPDPHLRQATAEALRKCGNIEGAALFATLAPRASRSDAVRALAAFQMAYNIVDALSEMPNEDPAANGAQLHRALLVALSPGAAHDDYYTHSQQGDDGGYLRELVDACREALAALPSLAVVAPAAVAGARRIVDFQALNLPEPQGGHAQLERWGTAAIATSSGLAWWEAAAAAGSSLGVHALIAAAADPRLDPAEVAEIAGAYHPWIGALHSLLDSLVDRREDREGGRLCLLDYYSSTTYAAARLADLAGRSMRAYERLPGGRAHRTIATAMVSYYLSAPECATSEARMISSALTRVLGCHLTVAILIFRARRLLRTATGRTYV